MLKKIFALGLIGTCLCQYGEENQPGQQYQQQSYKNGEYRPPPQILSHKQSLNHDGTFKYAFSSENGLLQGESISPDGSRTGAYAYLDPTGRKISVKYIAGKEGFKILEGDHIPKPPPEAALGPHPGYTGYNPHDDGSYRPEIAKPIYPQYKPELTKPIFPPFKPELSKFYGPQRPQIPKPLFNQFRQGADSGVGPQLFSKPTAYSGPLVSEKTNEVLHYPVAPPFTGGGQRQDTEPEYNDEPGKANSFGSGYSFEFSG